VIDLAQYADITVNDVPDFIINATLRKLGIRLDKEMLEEIHSAIASLKTKTTVGEFVRNHPRLSEMVGSAFMNEEERVTPAEFDCPICGFFSMDPQVVKQGVCPNC
jgi:hypothetical protein